VGVVTVACVALMTVTFVAATPAIIS